MMLMEFPEPWMIRQAHENYQTASGRRFRDAEQGGSAGRNSFLHRGRELAGFIKENGTGEYEIETSGDLGNVTEAHLVQVWRLPAGATLLGKDRGMDETTDAGRIELR